MSDSLVVRISTSRVVTWVIRHVASHVDPLLFKATNGRITSMGVPSMPMLTLTAIGARSGRPRAVHLACVQKDGENLVVASAMGQEKHPGWRYNLDANPRVAVQMRGERFSADAQVLTDSEKQEIWADIRKVIPQMTVYENRTDRNIRVYRLNRINS